MDLVIIGGTGKGEEELEMERILKAVQAPDEMRLVPRTSLPDEDAATSMVTLHSVPQTTSV